LAEKAERAEQQAEAPALRKTGINVSFGRREEHAGAKVITIKRTRPEGKGKTSTPPPPEPSQSKTANENKANHGVDGADQGPDGVDQPPDGVDHGVDVVSMAKADIDTNKSLKNNAGVDGADGDDVSSFPSGPAGNGADRLCAQCNGGVPTGSDAPTVKVGDVWLHGACRRFWLQETTSSRKAKGGKSNE
jgi:hypothetical protein